MTTINDTSSNNHHKNKKLLLISSIVFVVILFSSLFIVYKFAINDDGGVGGVWDVSLDDAVFVRSEVELERAVDGAVLGVSSVVVLTGDVFLSKSLVVGEGRNVTLTSNTGNGVGVGRGFFRLVGVEGERVVVVEGGGVLCLVGVVVTHEVGVKGGGVDVRVGGEFVLVRGEISGNTLADVWSFGGGVYNLGKFRMLGGEISSNNATYTFIPAMLGHGGAAMGWHQEAGGVYNSGVFELSGGSITNNAGCDTGGVYNRGTFVMFGGEITRNTASNGGGVYNYYRGNFTMFGGEITRNTASNGGGVYNYEGDFVMRGGLIAKNVAQTYGGGCGGGVYNGLGSTFTLYDGEIAQNTCEIPGDLSAYMKSAGYYMEGGYLYSPGRMLISYYGGGVCNSGTFSMFGGVITKNIVNCSGGGVSNSGNFIMLGGSIVNNRANSMGGGVYSISYDDKEFVFKGGVIVDNTSANGEGDNMYSADIRGNVLLIR